MLLDINGNRVNRDPHQKEYTAWCAEISPADLQAMEQVINDYCDDCDEIRSSFMPGKSPAIKALFPKLTVACNGNEEQAGLFFGNIVWRVICDRHGEDWRFSRSEDEEGMFYWCTRR